MKIAHFGTFDVANYGDLLFPLILEQRLKRLGHEIVHVSPVGGPPVWRDSVSSTGIADFFSEEWQSCDAFIVGGGNIVHAVPVMTSEYVKDGRTSCLAYPGLWLTPAIAARKRGIPLVWNAPGVSTNFNPDLHPSVMKALDVSAYVAVRDVGSRSLLHTASPDADVSVVPDTAFGLPDVWPENALRPIFQRIVQERGHANSDRFYVFHVKERYLSKGVDFVARGISLVCERDKAVPIILAIGPVHGDHRLAQEVAGKLSVPHMLIDRPDSLQEVTALLACSDAYCGSSLHGYLVASAYRIPAVIVADHDEHKFGGFAAHLDLHDVVSCDWKHGLQRCGVRIATATDAAYSHARQVLDQHWQQLIKSLEPSGSARWTDNCDPLSETMSIIVPGALDLLTSNAARKRDSEKILTRRIVEATEALDATRDVFDSIRPEIETVADRLDAQISAIDHSLAWRLIQLVRRADGRPGDALGEVRRSIESLRTLPGRISECGAASAPSHLSQTPTRVNATSHSRVWRLMQLVRRAIRRPGSALGEVRRSIESLRTLTGRISDRSAASTSTRVSQTPTRVVNWTVSIVVCVHNAPDDVRACLRSIEEHTNLEQHELILVDDGSAAEAESIVCEAAERLKATRIRNETPRGYTCAANQGLRQTDAGVCILLNSDTIVTSGWIEGLIRCAQSRDNVACVGPLSNAASWQSIPELTAEDGRWKVNDVPAGMNIDQFAAVLSHTSPRLYPETPLVNGFCYLITRLAIDTVGLLDEDTFPRGYCEEDDFSLRCQAAGLRHLIADDVYVFHAKSKSFTSSVREQIIAKSKTKLSGKHGRSRITGAVAEMKSNEDLLVSRVCARLAAEHAPSDRRTYRTTQPQRIAWVLPESGQVDPVRCAVEMTDRMATWGHSTVIVSPGGTLTHELSIQADVQSIDEARSQNFDVVICSDPRVVRSLDELTASRYVYYHLSPSFAYREKSPDLERFYRNDKPDRHIANSRWLGDLVQEQFGIDVPHVFAGGIDRKLFRPVRAQKDHQVVMYGSKSRYKGTSEIMEATGAHPLLNLTSPDLRKAENICRGRVFVSACWHEGFNFGPLEAMACGIPVVMAEDDFSRQYACHMENAWVVPAHDVRALREGIDAVLSDSRLRMKLIENGLETVFQYDWDEVTVRFKSFIDTVCSAVVPSPIAA